MAVVDMLASDSLIVVVRDALRAYRGKRCAEHEISDLLNDRATINQIILRRPAFFAFEENQRNPRHEFIKAWRRAWVELGATDAQNAMLRTNTFSNIHYQHGWIEQVAAMRASGFSHKANDAIYELFLADQQRKRGDS
jgi:hypothetical protein